MDSTPAELKPYLEAEKIRQKRKDAELWQAGIYETSATFTAVANALMVQITALATLQLLQALITVPMICGAVMAFHLSGSS